MSQRDTVFRIQTLSKSEYHLAKNIPEAIPKKKPPPERTDDKLPIFPTPLPFDVEELMNRDEAQYYSRSSYREENGNNQARKKQVPSSQKSKKKTRYDSSQDADIPVFKAEAPRRSHGRDSHTTSTDLETKFMELKEEKNMLDNKLRQANRTNISFQEELDHMRRLVNDLNMKFQEYDNDKNNLTEQLQKVKSVQKSLEKDLIRATDDKNSLILEYENKITMLKNRSLNSSVLNTQPVVEQQAEFRGVIVLLMAEIERLNNTLLDKEKRIEMMNKIYNETLLDSSRRVNSSPDKFRFPGANHLEAEITNLRKMLAESEVKMKFMAEELKRANEKNSVVIHETSSQYRDTPRTDEMFNYESPSHKTETQKRAGFRDSEYNNDSRRESELTANMQGAKISEYELKTVMFMIEIDRLGLVVSDLKTEMNFWKDKAINVVGHGQAEKIEEEKRSLELQLLGYKSKAQEFENLIRILKEENESLHQANMDQARDLQSWKMKYVQLESAQASINKDFEAKIMNLNEHLSIVQRENQSMKQDNVQKTLRLEELQGKLRSLENIELEVKAWKDKYSYLQGDVARLSEGNRSLVSENDQLKMKVQGYELQNGDLRKKIGQLESLHKDSQNLQGRLDQKNVELEELQRRLAMLQIENNNTSDKLRAEVKQLKDKRAEQEQSLLHLQEQSSRANYELKEKQRELEEFRGKYSLLEKNSTLALRELTDELEKQNRNELRELQQKIDFLNHEKISMESHVKEVNKKLVQYQAELPSLRNEVEKLNLVAQQREDEIRIWKERALSVEQLKDKQIELLRQETDSHRKMTIDLELRRLGDKFNVERSEYENIIKQLKQQIAALEDKLVLTATEFDRLNLRYETNLHELERARQAENKASNRSFDYDSRLKSEKNMSEAEVSRLKQMNSQLQLKLDETIHENRSLQAQYLDSVRQLGSAQKNISYLDYGSQGDLNRSRSEQLRKSPYQSRDVDLNLSQTENIEQRHRSRAYREGSQDRSLYSEKNDNLYLSQALHTAREEISQSDHRYKELEAEYMLLSRKHEQLYKEAEELQRSRDYYKSHAEINKSDIAKKNRELVAKIQEVDELKTRYEEALANVDPVVTGTSRIVTRISITKDHR